MNANDVWFLDLINAVYIATLRLLHGNGSQEKKEEEEDYIPMNDEPSTVVLNCITEAVVICVVIM